MHTQSLLNAQVAICQDDDNNTYLYIDGQLDEYGETDVILDRIAETLGWNTNYGNPITATRVNALGQIVTGPAQTLDDLDNRDTIRAELETKAAAVRVENETAYRETTQRLIANIKAEQND